MMGGLSQLYSFPRAGVCASTLGALLLGVLTGCGSSGSPITTSSVPVPSSPATPITESRSDREAVAYVANVPIPKSGYEHWLSIERAFGLTGKAPHKALGFLITSEWVLEEAAALGISVSESEVKQAFVKTERKGFSKSRALKQFLAKYGETEADLLARQRVELLESRIAAKVTAGKSGSQRQALLASFGDSFERRWKARTRCRAEYLMEYCSEYKGEPEELTAKAAPPQSSGSSSSNGSGELPAPSGGAMAITSPAFELNEQIPSRYTCDGADISPPLEWRNVPAKAKALVLFVIDMTQAGPAAGSHYGIRWIVGDINPRSDGVAAGGIPAGGIVGSDSNGSPGYGGICAAPGKTDTIEFVLYALKEKIPLPAGFKPQRAEVEYGSQKLLLGSAATYYGSDHRP
jgi:hypothetical protein